MLNIFNTNKPFILFFLPFLSALVWLPGMLDMQEGFTVKGMPFFNGLSSIVTSSIARNFLVFLVILSGGFMLNKVIVKHDLLNKNTNLSATIYVILFGLLTIVFSMNPVIFANLFLIMALDKTLSLYNQPKVYNFCFVVGMLIALATHFYLPAFLFLVLFFAALIIIRTFDWRDWVITIFGFVLPFLYSWTYYFWFDRLPEYYTSFVTTSNFFNNGFDQVQLFQKAAFLLLVFVGVIRLIGKMNRETVRQKNLLTVILVYMFICLVSLLINSMDWVELYLLSIVPLSIMLAVFFQSIKKRWMAESLFALFVLLLVTTIGFWML